MQSSFKIIETEYNCTPNASVTQENKGSKDSIKEKYEELCATLLYNANVQKDNMISEAYLKAKQIEEDAYKKAFEEGNNKGYKEGYDKGYKDSYEKNIKLAQEESKKIYEEAEKIYKDAEDTLKVCNIEYSKYLESRKENIKDLIISISKKILKKEVISEDSLNELLVETIKDIKNSPICIIKCNPLYENSIREASLLWRKEMIFPGEIFVVTDSGIEVGNAIIERDKGKIIVGIDVGLGKIKEALSSDV